jgi:hypothetical protein
LGLFAEKHGIKWGTIEDLISYRVENEKTIERIDERPFNTKYGEWTLVSFLDCKDLACSCNISVNRFSICTRTQTGVSLSILPLTKAVCV